MSLGVCDRQRPAADFQLFGKPCVTTCPFHPDNPERKEKPCGLVLDGLTHAGGSCLDKTVYVHALESLMGAS